MEQKTIELVGRYAVSMGRPAEIEIAGSPEGLGELIRLLSGDGFPAVCRLVLPNASPSPYDHYIEGLLLNIGGDAIQTQIEGGGLRLTESQRCLKQLGETIQYLVDNPEPSNGVQRHLHVEYREGIPDQTLDSSAFPFVFTVTFP